MVSGRFRRRGTRRTPLIRQSEATECGLACLAMVAQHHGHDLDMPAMRRRLGTSANGVTLASLVKDADRLGFESRALRIELAGLGDLAAPAILHWDGNHFVVLLKAGGRGVKIHDPARGTLHLGLDDVSRRFTGIALELKPKAGFEPLSDRSRFTLARFTGPVTGGRRLAGQAVLLAAAVELIALVLPLQTQLFVDRNVGAGHAVDIAVACLAFATLIGIQTSLSLLKAWLVTWASSTLGLHWNRRLFRHLLDLPPAFFERRQTGDVLSRFQSLGYLQSLVTGASIDALLDGVIGLLAGIAMYCYDPTLALVTFAACLAYIALRFATMHALREANEAQLTSGSRQNTELMESVRGIQAIQLANAQALRQARLATAVTEAARHDLRRQRITVAATTLGRSLFAVQRTVLLGVAAGIVASGRLSMGMAIAFITYSDQFASKLASLVDKAAEFRLMDVHLARIGDIAMSPAQEHRLPVRSRDAIAGRISVRNLGFRYAPSSPWVFRQISFDIEIGECVAIAGPSGCGKSTLAKLILGLLEPTEGNILIDGIDLRMIGLDRYRDVVGAVLQDDYLFAGTLGDNISFFDGDARPADVIAAARMAAIHDDIVRLPMAYDTPVGDMGATLSGGQRQRVILARALYRQPRILVMDEATSHLDANLESRVNASISTLECTRLLIAHRRETLRAADRVIALDVLVEPSAAHVAA